jgi:hypothetical protein
VGAAEAACLRLEEEEDSFVFYWRSKVSQVRRYMYVCLCVLSHTPKVCPTSHEAGGEEELGVVQQYYVWRPL